MGKPLRLITAQGDRLKADEPFIKPMRPYQQPTH